MPSARAFAARISRAAAADKRRSRLLALALLSCQYIACHAYGVPSLALRTLQTWARGCVTRRRMTAALVCAYNTRLPSPPCCAGVQQQTFWQRSYAVVSLLHFGVRNMAARRDMARQQRRSATFRALGSRCGAAWDRTRALPWLARCCCWRVRIGERSINMPSARFVCFSNSVTISTSLTCCLAAPPWHNISITGNACYLRFVTYPQGRAVLCAHGVALCRRYAHCLPVWAVARELLLAANLPACQQRTQAVRCAVLSWRVAVRCFKPLHAAWFGAKRVRRVGDGWRMRVICKHGDDRRVSCAANFCAVMNVILRQRIVTLTT